MKQLLGDDFLDITSLKVVGPINGDDVRSLRQMLGGSDGWNDVAQYFRFAERGVLGTVPIELVKGANYKISGNDSVIPGMMTTIQITPEKGYALNSILVNGEEYIKKILIKWLFFIFFCLEI